MIHLLLILSLLLLVAVLILQLTGNRRPDRALSGLLKQSFESAEKAQERAERNLVDQIGKNRTELLAATRDGRKELDDRVKLFGDTLEHRLTRLTATNDDKFDRLRETVEKKLASLQSDNMAALEKIRGTVDEKLQGTLEKRLGAAFKQVSERLETVQQGLGEMKQLAADVGDFKKVLTNVKSRGTWGEVQLQAILEELMAPGQYEANVKPVPGSNEVVEFAIRLPGTDSQSQVWLPLDAKFPQEDYVRLQEAQDRGDAEGCETAIKGLEKSIIRFAADIKDKYISPPHTTNFAILFLPTEGLYAEALRRVKVVDQTQRMGITLAGPTTLTAILNALRMGFHTLAIEKRSGEVWEVLGAVKTEFGKFGEVLDKLKVQLGRAQQTIDDTGVRTRAMERKLRDVQQLPEDRSRKLLDLTDMDGD